MESRPARWKRFEGMATGCTGMYFHPGGDSGPRLRPPQAALQDASKDPLTDGFPVLHYYQASRSFERRILKVDTRRTTLFLLQMNKTEKRWQDPVCMRIGEIGRVLSGSEALRLCMFHNVSYATLEAKTAVVLQVGTVPEGETPPIEKLQFLLAPPRLQLQVMLGELIAARVRVAHALPQRTEKASSSKAKSAKASAAEHHEHAVYWWCLEAMRIRDLGKVFDSKPECDVEFKLRSLNEKNMPSKACNLMLHVVGSSFQTVGQGELLDATQSELNKLQERIGPLRPLDRARVKLTIHELGILTKWALVVAEDYPDGLYHHLSDRQAIMAHRPVRGDEIEIIQEAMPPEPGMPETIDTMGRNSLRAAIEALRQMVEFEDLYDHALQGSRVEQPKVRRTETKGEVAPGLGTSAPQGVRKKTELHLTLVDLEPAPGMPSLDTYTVSMENPAQYGTRVNLERKHGEYVGTMSGLLDNESLLVCLLHADSRGAEHEMCRVVLDKDQLTDKFEGDLQFKDPKDHRHRVRAVARFRVKRIHFSQSEVDHVLFMHQANSVLALLDAEEREEHQRFLGEAVAVLGRLGGDLPPDLEHMAADRRHSRRAGRLIKSPQEALEARGAAAPPTTEPPDGGSVPPEAAPAAVGAAFAPYSGSAPKPKAKSRALPSDLSRKMVPRLLK